MDRIITNKFKHLWTKRFELSFEIINIITRSQIFEQLLSHMNKIKDRKFFTFSAEKLTKN